MRLQNCFLATAVLFIFFSCDLPTSPVVKDTGSAQVTIIVGNVGSLAKTAVIEMRKLYIQLSATGETTIYDSIALSGNTQQSITKTYNNLASLLKTWTLTAVAKDINGVTIHSGSTTFTVPAKNVITISLNLAAQYSMLKANFYPIRDSVTSCSLSVNGARVAGLSFPKQTKLGDTVKLAYDYLSASPSPGTSHTIKMDVLGSMWGFDTLLYTGQTTINVISGENASYTITLRWVGPSAPPPGAVTMTVVLGAIGTVTVDGELFKPEPGMWYSATPDPIARNNATGAVVNGKLYVIGGGTPDGDIATCEEFDPVTNKWSTRSPMPTARQCPTATAVDGKIYVIGGSSTTAIYNINEMYDPLTDTWITKAPMPTARIGHVSACVNGKIYAIGGYNGSNIAVNEEYSPATDSWTVRAAMPSPRGGGIGEEVDGLIYVIGGRDYPAYSTATEAYDPLTDAWAAKSPMPTQRDVMFSGAFNGKIYVMGGSCYSDILANEGYDTFTNSWTTMTPLSSGRTRAAVGVINGLLYVVGGTKAGNTFSNANDVYCLP